MYSRIALPEHLQINCSVHGSKDHATVGTVSMAEEIYTHFALGMIFHEMFGKQRNK